MTKVQGNPRVIYEKRGQVAYITLNRPEVLNAMDTKMHEELVSIWDDFEADENIRLGVLSGKGSKAFSVGLDLKELNALSRNGQSSVDSFGSRGRPGFPRITERFNRVKPLIAKVHGYALGGGFELALACDIILASNCAQFALPEAKLGLISGAGGGFRLARQIPWRIALGYLLTGRMLPATRAFELGLVNEVVPITELDDCVEKWTDDILRCAPLSIYAIRESLVSSEALSMKQAFLEPYQWEEKRRNSRDAIEGVRAFSEKRSPQWQGS